jgi:hypothetical protein
MERGLYQSPLVLRTPATSCRRHPDKQVVRATRAATSERVAMRAKFERMNLFDVLLATCRINLSCGIISKTT